MRQFGPFCLDVDDRRLSRGRDTVELPARYLDVLILLVKSDGALVTKDQFMDEVWRGVPVTDEALTQAIRTLRKALGDSAGAPRFIKTVPKHGYRFIAPLSETIPAAETPARTTTPVREGIIRQTSAGIVGALLAGALVGLLYGFAGAAQAVGGGAVSLLLVIVLVSAFSAGAAGAGIALGIMLSRAIRSQGWQWLVAGGALGGTTLGAFGNMIGKDAFRLLFGHAVGPFAGAMEGFVVGGAAGLAFFVMQKQVRYSLGLTAFIGAASGLIVALLEGHMMAGSLQTLITAFPSSQFRLDSLGQMLGEPGFGPNGRAVTFTLEGATFISALVKAMHHAVRCDGTDQLQ
ncbi:winged helix-turn-helix domain-containing protein [Sphingomonas prati]|uniref:DNA-binding winged helix-turn-helix (WHTH) protein n=1 Tax=Sphingomonas prati TaxID=1843237 RepID=A0A7W9BVF2_9SPHN|nr:transcriptional regulator [Sphingomonas prati]MBB5730842.1 DNA-binding winged helix-turn-helix (wHTH) protein [Sphingomonas prati]GGE97327.1 hypothetical protein GCM10011404_33100 [Sphingomonas prati]